MVIGHGLNPVSRQTQRFVDNLAKPLTILCATQNSIYNSPQQQLAQLRHGQRPRQPLQPHLHYDNAGNITAITGNNAPNNQSYGYDEREQLTSCTPGSTTQTFTYPATGSAPAHP
jgi:YD repeat-containing protein